jgi:hypothetical protein
VLNIIEKSDIEAAGVVEIAITRNPVQREVDRSRRHQKERPNINKPPKQLFWPVLPKHFEFETSLEPGVVKKANVFLLQLLELVVLMPLSIEIPIRRASAISSKQLLVVSSETVPSTDHEKMSKKTL